jgi:hypothetical protein
VPYSNRARRTSRRPSLSPTPPWRPGLHLGTKTKKAAAPRMVRSGSRSLFQLTFQDLPQRRGVVNRERYRFTAALIALLLANCKVRLAQRPPLPHRLVALITFPLPLFVNLDARYPNQFSCEIFEALHGSRCRLVDGAYRALGVPWFSLASPRHCCRSTPHRLDAVQ